MIHHFFKSQQTREHFVSPWKSQTVNKWHQVNGDYKCNIIQYCSRILHHQNPYFHCKSKGEHTQVLRCSNRLSRYPVCQGKRGFRPWNQSGDRWKGKLIWIEEWWLDGSTVNTGCHHMTPWSSWVLAIYSPVISSDDPCVRGMATYFVLAVNPWDKLYRKTGYERSEFHVTCLCSGQMLIRDWAVSDVPRAAETSLTYYHHIKMLWWMF